MGTILSDAFLIVLNMSLTALWVLAAVLILRLLLGRAPKRLTCLLWAAAGVRLVLPFSLETALSLIPSAQTVSPAILDDSHPVLHTGFDTLNATVNPGFSQAFAPADGASVNPLYVTVLVLALVWLIGLTGLLTYAASATWRLRRSTRVSMPLQPAGGSRLPRVYLCDTIDTPFILGIIRPRIYLPSAPAEVGREEELARILSHEEAHLCRRDYIWKPLGFLLTAIHWFNPLVWVGYILMCRDMETACDECVIRQMDTAGRQDYARTLLAWSTPRRAVTVCPVAFGEVGVKSRIKAVLNYKKPGLGLIAAAAVALVFVSVCFLTNPKISSDSSISPDGLRLKPDGMVCDASIFSYSVRCEQIGELRVDADGKLWGRDLTSADEEPTLLGTLTSCNLSRSDFDSLFVRSNAYSWFDGESIYRIKRDTVRAYLITPPASGGIYPYMLLLDKDGGARYVFVNTKENGEPDCIRWIFRMAPVPADS